MKAELTTPLEFCTIILKNIKKVSSTIKNSCKFVRASVIAMDKPLPITVLGSTINC